MTLLGNTLYIVMFMIWHSSRYTKFIALSKLRTNKHIHYIFWAMILGKLVGGSWGLFLGRWLPSTMWAGPLIFLSATTGGGGGSGVYSGADLNNPTFTPQPSGGYCRTSPVVPVLLPESARSCGTHICETIAPRTRATPLSWYAAVRPSMCIPPRPVKPLNGFSPFEVRIWNCLDLKLYSFVQICPFASHGIAHEPKTRPRVKHLAPIFAEHISPKPQDRFTPFYGII